MFNSNLIMAVKVNGKILREFDGTVALPFGSEYSIYLKNTSNRKASVKIEIDGQNIYDDGTIIVPANSHIEIQRFIKSGNLDSGNAFKFIEKTKKIEDFRGNKAEDGLLTVTYSFEMDRVVNTVVRYQPQLINKLHLNDDIVKYSQTITDNTAWTNYTVADAYSHARNVSVYASQSVNTAGITAPGSVVEQKFTPSSGFVCDGKFHTMTLKMVGAVGDTTVSEPVTVSRKIRCTMCGTYCKQTDKFCHECGASVVIV